MGKVIGALSHSVVAVLVPFIFVVLVVDAGVFYDVRFYLSICRVMTSIVGPLYAFFLVVCLVWQKVKLITCCICSRKQMDMVI